MVMQPRPMAEPSRPLEPSLRCCINDSPSDGSSYRRHYLVGAQMCSPASHREGRLLGLLLAATPFTPWHYGSGSVVAAASTCRSPPEHCRRVAVSRSEGHD